MARYVLRVNGKDHEVDAEPGDSLLSLLRDDLGLTGSKFGCGEGFCGACTVLIDGQLTRSCVTRVGAVAGKAIATVESLAAGDRLHPVQQAFLDAEAFQCGYCTSGMIVSAAALLERTPNPSQQEIIHNMEGNVCRCGAYARIAEAIHRAASLRRGQKHA